MSFKSVIYKNLIFSTAGKLLNFSFFVFLPYFISDAKSTDSNLFYYAIITNAVTLFTVILANVVSSVIVKEIYTKAGKDDQYIKRLISGLFFRLLTVAIIQTVILKLFQSTIVGFFHIKTYSFQYELYLLYFGLSIINEFLRCIMQSYNLFNQYSKIVVFQNIIQYSIFLAIYPINKDLCVPMAIFLSSFALMIILLISLYKHKLLFVPQFTFKVNSEYELGNIALPLFLAHIITIAVSFFFDYYASSFHQGIYTIYNLSFRLYNLPLVFIINPLNEILLKRFSEYTVSGDDKLSIEILHLLKLVLLAVVPVIVFFFLFLNPSNAQIAINYLGNSKFNIEQITIFFNLLKILGIYLIFNTVNQLASRVFFAFNETLRPCIIGSLYFLISLIFLVIYQHHIYGIMFSKTIPEVLFLTPLNLYLLKYLLPQFDFLTFFRFFLKAIFIVLFAISVFYAMNHLIDNKFSLLISLISLTISLSLFVYIFLKDLKTTIRLLM